MLYRKKTKFALKHLVVSALVASIVAGLILGVWYPPPYSSLAGGFTLLGFIIAIDVICGPLLSWVVYNPEKSRKELFKDIGAIILLQVSALCYGVYSAAQARPIFLAFEGNRFRVVSMADIDKESLNNASPEFRNPGFRGPNLVGVKLTSSTDPDFQNSILLSMQGLPPAFRPSRWVSYETQLPELRASLLSLDDLKGKNPEAIDAIDRSLKKISASEDGFGYLPVNSEKAKPLDWVAIVNRESGEPKIFLPLDGW